MKSVKQRQQQEQLKGERQKALKRTIADRMAKGAKDHGLDEERKLRLVLLDNQFLIKNLGQRKDMNLKRKKENLKKMPGDAPGESKLIQLMRDRAKKEGNYSESID